jgi:hypothetical protein
MRYVSPFALFELEEAQVEVTEKDLFLRKRKLLSEFELFNTSTIDVNGQQLSKNDVLKMFNTFENDANLNFHLIVAKDKTLLCFLEQHQIEFKQKFSIPPQDLTPEFIEWVSPYFREAFTETAMASIQNRDLLSFNTLMMNPRYMTAADEMLAWQPVQKYFYELIFQLSEINDAGSQLRLEWDIKIIGGKDMQEIVRHLPIEKFQSQINAYAYELMRAALGIFTFDRVWSLHLITDALSLPITEDIRETLEEKQNEIETAAQRGYSGRSKKSPDYSSLWTIVRALLFCIFIAARMSNGCDSSSNNNESYFPTTYDHKTSEEMMKDIMEKANKSSASSLNESVVSFLTAIDANRLQFNNAGVQKYLHNGDDPYTDIWNSIKEEFHGPFQDKRYVYYNNHMDTAGITKFIASPYQPLAVKNKSDYNALVIINRGDSIFSTYLNAGTQLRIPLLKDCQAYAFVCAGKKFMMVPGVNIKVNFPMGEKNMLLPGCFENLTSENSVFMKTSIPLNNISTFTITNESSSKIGVKTDSK